MHAYSSTGNNKVSNPQTEIGKHVACYQTQRVDVHAVCGKHEACKGPLAQGPEIKEAEHLTCDVLAE